MSVRSSHRRILALSMTLSAPLLGLDACSNASTPAVGSSDGGADVASQAPDSGGLADSALPPADTSVPDAAVGDAAGDALGDALATTPDADASPGPGSDAAVDAASGGEGSMDAAVSFPPGPNMARWGGTCAAPGLFGYGDGSLLLCESGAWRYALRSDVPDGVYGGFTSRPDWYPPLRSIYSLPADSCTLSLADAPIDPADVTTVLPMGAMIGGHVTPIDHAYISVAGTAQAPTPIVATADGVVLSVASLGTNSVQIILAHACETVSVYWVVNQLAGVLAPYQSTVASGGAVAPQLSVKAGDLIGQQWLTPMDFAIQDGSKWLSGFAHPFPYVSQDAWKPYTADFLAYLPAPAATVYATKLQRTVAPVSGKLDDDGAGTAAGNWYLDGTFGFSGMPASAYQQADAAVPGGQVPGKNVYSWSHLSLSPHWVDPSVWIASIGSWADAAGDGMQFAISPGPASPASLSVGQTAVYELVDWAIAPGDGGTFDAAAPLPGYSLTLGSQTMGVLAVKVNADNTLTVEKRPDLTSASSFTGFTALAQTYWR